MSTTPRYITPIEAAQPGWEHTTANHDLLCTDELSTDIFWTTDDTVAPGHDPNTGATLSIKADQTIFLDGRVPTFGFINFNLYGLDTMSLPGATRPLIITNIAGQFKANNNLTVAGARNCLITGEYVPGVSGDSRYRGHSGLGGFGTSQGKYGIKIHQENPNAQAIGLTKDLYGTMHFGCSDIEVAFVELSGGFACFQIKSDYLSDSGYNYQEGFQSYWDITTPTGWTASTSYTTDQVVEGFGVGASAAPGATGSRRFYVQGDYTSATSSISADVIAGDLVELDKASATMWNMYIHDVYIHDAGREGIYAGHTGTPGYKHHSIHMRVENSRFIRTGGEAIQMGRLIPNMANYAIDTDDDISQWKSVVRHCIIQGGASQWLRDGGDGFYNFQDKGMQIGHRSGGVEFAYNIVGGGASDGCFFQLDGSGETFSQVAGATYAFLGEELDIDTHFHIHDNYIIGSRGTSWYSAKHIADSITHSYITFENNYFAHHKYEMGVLIPGSTHSNGLLNGNNNISYINVDSNTYSQTDGRPLVAAFSPTTTRLTETNTTLNMTASLIEMVNSGWDDSIVEYSNHEWWVLEVAAGNGRPDTIAAPTGSRTYPVGHTVYKDNLNTEKDFMYVCKVEHATLATNEPNVGATWETYWDQVPRLRADDWRLVPGSYYHNLGIGLSSSYDTKYTDDRTYSGDALNIIFPI